MSSLCAGCVPHEERLLACAAACDATRTDVSDSRQRCSAIVEQLRLETEQRVDVLAEQIRDEEAAARENVEGAAKWLGDRIDDEAAAREAKYIVSPSARSKSEMHLKEMMQH